MPGIVSSVTYPTTTTTTTTTYQIFFSKEAAQAELL